MKTLLFAVAFIFAATLSTQAQTGISKTELEGVFVFSDPQPIYDASNMQVATEYRTDCMWKPHTRRCRQKDGNCTKGHTKFDMSDELMEATLVVPGEDVDLTTAPQVPVSIMLGAEIYEEGEPAEATVYIEEL